MVSLLSAQEDGTEVKKPVLGKDSLTIKEEADLGLKSDISFKVLETFDIDSLRIHPAADSLDLEYMNYLYEADLFEYMHKNIVQHDYAEKVAEKLDSATLAKRLQELDESTPFNIQYTPVLAELINKKLSYKRIYMERIMRLSDYYFPMFEQVLDRYDIPLEMKYLAIVESALDPLARSRVGATGLWQFMYATGRMHDLEINSYVDERMDPLKATDAACRFLKTLHEMYGDWDLALAAYNSGPGNVNKAIRRSGGYTNYWNIRPFLPRETAGYVPAFQATMYLFNHAGDHGFNPRRSRLKMIETDTVQIQRALDFDLIAAFTELDKEEIRFLNPIYKLDVIPSNSKKKYYLRLPRNLIGKFVSNEDEIYAFAKAEEEKGEKPLPELTATANRITYRVRSGDYLGKIANRYGVKVSQIKRWNNLRSSRINIGQRLYLYSRELPKRKPKPKPTESENYTVKEGDRLWKIAARTGVSQQELRKLNDLGEEPLKPGTELRLKAK